MTTLQIITFTILLLITIPASAIMYLKITQGHLWSWEKDTTMLKWFMRLIVLMVIAYVSFITSIFLP